jgi:hypothetical protein
MLMKRLVWAAPLIVMGVALVGCGGPTKDATYENATKLREAVIASGVDCPGDASKPSDDGTEDFIKCSTNMGLHTFKEDKDMVAGKVLTEFSKTPSLQGTRWLIEDSDATVLGKLKEKLGGSVVVP